MLTAVQRILASSEARISSSRESRACDISGLIEVRVRDLNSVPYRCFTSRGRLGCIIWKAVTAKSDQNSYSTVEIQINTSEKHIAMAQLHMCTIELHKLMNENNNVETSFKSRF